MEGYKDAILSLTTLPQSTQRLSWTHKDKDLFIYTSFLRTWSVEIFVLGVLTLPLASMDLHAMIRRMNRRRSLVQVGNNGREFLIGHSIAITWDHLLSRTH